MTAVEAEAFEQDLLCAVRLRMRQWDELAKEMRVPMIDLGILKGKAVELLSRNA